MSFTFTVAGIVETTKFLNTTFINVFKLKVVAKDGFSPPAVSNLTVLYIHVTKTPAIWLTNLKTGTTSLEASVDVSEFSYLKITEYQILVQLFEPDDPKCKSHLSRDAKTTKEQGCRLQ